MFQLSFLGLGKMGTSILKGVLAKGLYSPEEISFFAPSKATQEKGLAFGVHLAKDERDLFEGSSLVILAIEPQKYDVVFAKLSGLSFAGKTIVSLAPGKDIANLESVFEGASIARAMPNTPCLIGEGMTTLAFSEGPNQEVVKIFDSIGQSIVLEEAQIDAAIPLQGSMPAYIFEYVKEFVQNGEKQGIEADIAAKLALRAMIGSCKLALESNLGFDELIASVCSPGGATIAGLSALREAGFAKAVEACYEACVKRGKDLKAAK